MIQETKQRQYNNNLMENRLEIYKSNEGIEVSVLMDEDMVWATQKQMAEIFGTTPQNITIHLKRIYQEGEVDEKATCKEYLQVQTEGKRQVRRRQLMYNQYAHFVGRLSGKLKNGHAIPPVGHQRNLTPCIKGQ